MDLQKEIKALERSISLRGRLLEEDKDSITIQMANSLLQIPREFIGGMSDIDGISNTEGADKSRLVEVSLTKDAKIIQKTLVTPEEAIAGAITADNFNPVSSSFGTMRRPENGISFCTDCSFCICNCDCDCSRCSTAFWRGSYLSKPRFRTSIDDR